MSYFLKPEDRLFDLVIRIIRGEKMEKTPLALWKWFFLLSYGLLLYGTAFYYVFPWFEEASATGMFVLFVWVNLIGLLGVLMLKSIAKRTPLWLALLLGIPGWVAVFWCAWHKLGQQ